MQNWYVVHSKPRQEKRAQNNLIAQGFECFFPIINKEKIHQGKVVLLSEPLFPRYLFVQIKEGNNWGCIRSTLGVSKLVTFGQLPAKVPLSMIETLQKHQLQSSPPTLKLFEAGQLVTLHNNGPYSGLDAVYQMPDGQQRAYVLIELLGKYTKLLVDIESLTPSTHP